MTGIPPPLRTSLLSCNSEVCHPHPISEAPADAALLLLSQHTASPAASACSSAHPAVTITRPCPSPICMHHLAVSITQPYPFSCPPRHLLLHQQSSPGCSCSTGCQHCPARSACTFPVSAASSAAQTPQPTAGISSGSPGMSLCPAKPPASPLPSCFPSSSQVRRQASCKGSWSGGGKCLKVPWSGQAVAPWTCKQHPCGLAALILEKKQSYSGR